MLFCSPSVSTHKYSTERKSHNFTDLVGSLKYNRHVNMKERQMGITIKNFWVVSEEIPHKHKRFFFCVHLGKTWNHSPITAYKQTKQRN